ncbi:MAG: ABC transporter permease [Clostridiales bacterium]|nr:ABC transporter permease [Clostridiales bacterium]
MNKTVKQRKQFDFQKFSSRYSLLLILIVFMAISSLLNETFLTTRNLINVVRQQSVFIIIALGQMMLIISGMLDLSAGAVIAFAGCLSINVYKATGNMGLAILVAILVSVIANGLSGVMVTVFKTPAFIATLAMQTIARGAALKVTGGQNIYEVGDYGRLGQGDLWGIPYPAMIMIAISIIMLIVMKYTRFGRSTYAVGGNIDAARASGINVNSVQLRAFLLHGILVGIAAVIYMSRVNSGIPNGAQGYEFDALTATVIGGTSFTGGVGNVGNTIIGAFLVGFMNNIMNILSIDSYVQQMIRGVIIAGAVIWDINAKDKGGKTKLLKRIKTNS